MRQWFSDKIPSHETQSKFAKAVMLLMAALPAGRLEVKHVDTLLAVVMPTGASAFHPYLHCRTPTRLQAMHSHP